MFKRLVNEAEIFCQIEPVSPLLIKAAPGTVHDPSRPDIMFVETTLAGDSCVYLPGSSLKGAIRTQSERIIRTVGGKDRSRRPWSCDPLSSDSPCRRLKGNEPEKFANLCNACRLFGSREFASHFIAADAYPATPPKLEERNSIAVDRVLGSAVGAPTNFEVVVAGRFQGYFRLVNFSLDQLGLIALVLRDLDRHQVTIGAGRTRGLGRVSVKVMSVTIRYPGCELDEGIWSSGAKSPFKKSEVLGAGVLFKDAAMYGYSQEDSSETSAEAAPDELGIGVIQEFRADSLDELWRVGVSAWKKQMRAAVK